MNDTHPFNTDYTKRYRTSDQIIDAWNKRKDLIISLLYDNPLEFVQKFWTDPRIISVSRDCRYNCGVSNSTPPFDVFNRCSECVLMDRLLNIREGLGKHEIEHGKHKSNCVYIKCKDLTYTYLAITKRQKCYLKHVLEKTSYLDCQSLPSEDITYIGGDRNTNNLIISMLLEKIMNKKSLPNYQKLYNFYVCGGMGFSIYEYSSCKNIKELNDKKQLCPATCLQIVQQLITIMNFLKQFSFIHGSPNLKSLLFENKSFGFKTRNKTIRSTTTLKLSRFYNSGITCNNFRVYSRSLACEEKLTSDKNGLAENVYMPSFPKIEKSYDDSHSRYYFGDAGEFLSFYRHSGIPLYCNSFDIICFLLSLMSFQPFYKNIMKNDSFVNTWNELWLKCDRDDLDERFAELHNSDLCFLETTDIVRALVDKRIRCDAVSFLHQRLVLE